jgi:RHS repeat-associated protein
MLLAGVAHAGTRHYYYTDPQGTVLAKADAQGNIIASYDYAPYGTQALGTAPSGPGYTGHVNDPDTGLVYMQARYYDPSTGRFLSADPAGPSPGNLFNFNRYDYANNNPINHTDPDGRCADGMSCDTMVQNYGKWANANPAEADNLGEKVGLPGVGAMLALSGVGEVAVGVEAIRFFVRTVRFDRRLAKVRNHLKNWKESPNKKSVGSRFEDPANPKGNRVRVDMGDPNHSLPSQRVDHVVEQRNGVTVDANSKPITAAKPASTPEAHVPLKTWLEKNVN